MSVSEFFRCAGIQQCHAAIPGQLVHICLMPLLQNAVCNVIDHKTCHINRVLGGGIGRRVGQIKFLQFGGFHSCVDSGGNHIDTLVHTFIAHDLCPQQAVSLLFKDHLYGHHLAAGIVACAAHGRQDDRIHIQSGFFRVGFVNAGRCRCHVENLDHRAALRTFESAVSAADVVCRNAPLLVCGACQRNQGILPGDEVFHLHSVAYRIDVRDRSLHPVVDHDASLDTQFQSGIFGKTGIRGNPDCQHYHVGMERHFIFQQYIHASVFFFKSLHGVPQGKLHAVLSHLCVYKSGHVRVKGVHELFGALDDGDLHPQLPQVFRQLQTDEAAAR